MLKALILVAEGFDDLQVFYPWFRMREEGIRVTLAGPSRSAGTGPSASSTNLTVAGKHGYRVEPDASLRQVSPSDFDVLIIPGGHCTELLRLREEAVDLARTFMDEDRLVATICHGPQLLISAGSVSGRQLTSAPGIRDDLRMAGALYLDEPVVVDGNLVACRGSQDLPDLMRRLIGLLRQQR